MSTAYGHPQGVEVSG